MNNTFAQILLISILLFSCAGEESKVALENDKAPIEEIDSSSNVESIKEMSDSIVESEKKFQLPDPDMTRINQQALSSNHSDLYLYLLNNFDTLEAKALTDISKSYEYPCDFYQTFSDGIIYYQGECSSGVAQYELTVPKVEISALKLLFAQLFESDGYYHWNTDSLYHTTDENGINGAGGEFRYEVSDDQVKVKIIYTD